MEAKEKAKELVGKYTVLHYEQKNGSIIIDVETSKQCALIAVDEILEELLECGEVWMKSRIKYWQEVKQEIINI